MSIGIFHFEQAELLTLLESSAGKPNQSGVGIKGSAHHTVVRKSPPKQYTLYKALLLRI